MNNRRPGSLRANVDTSAGNYTGKGARSPGLETLNCKNNDRRCYLSSAASVATFSRECRRLNSESAIRARENDTPKEAQLLLIIADFHCRVTIILIDRRATCCRSSVEKHGYASLLPVPLRSSISEKPRSVQALPAWRIFLIREESRVARTEREGRGGGGKRARVRHVSRLEITVGRFVSKSNLTPG